MSRLAAGVEIVITDPDQLFDTQLIQNLFGQGAEDVEIENNLISQARGLFNALVAEDPTADPQVVFLAPGGAGDGPSFTLSVEVVGAPIDSNGAPLVPAALLTAVYTADTVQGLDAARLAAFQRWVERVSTAPEFGGGTIDEVTFLNNWIVGASKGTRVMGVDFMFAGFS